MTDVTRTLMLRAGRASLGIWLREGIVADPLLRQHSHASYDRLAGQVPWPVHPVLRLHLVFSVLPGAAFYTAMREQGWTEDAAADAVARTLTAMARPHRRLIQRLTRHESGRRLFMRVAAGGTPLAFPAPGWQTTWIDRSPTRVAFDMTRCFILDLLRRLEATAIAPAYCAVDNTLYDNLCPELCWARTGTLANGASHCDFRFEHRTRSRLFPGVNDSGRRFFSITTKISRRDPRPCPHEYHPPIVYTPRSTRCSPPVTTWRPPW